MPDPAEPTPTPDAAPPPKPRRGVNWHRVRVYFWSILIMAAMWVCATVVTIRLHPKRVVERLLAEMPFSASTGRVYWVNRRTLEIEDLRMGALGDLKNGQFFYARTIIVTASPFGLWQHHIAKVQINEGQVLMKALYAALDRAGSGSGKGIDWSIGRLEINRGTIMMDNLLEDTVIPVTIGRRHPVVLTGLRLGEPDSSQQMTEPRTLEIGAVSIASPIDPTSPVFFFPLTRVTYTYGEIWRHRVRKIEMIRPTMFLGEDLFWLTKQFKKAHAGTPAEGPTAPWRVGRFEVAFGQLAVNAFGQPVVHLPFYFNTKVDDIRLDQLDQVSAKSSVTIQRLDQDYPDYKVRIVNLRGKLFFSWPPSDEKANNVVNTIKIDELSWNEIPATQVWSNVTFDPNGVYGTLGGVCEGGQISGNFEFYYSKGFTWNADLFATKINCQPIAEKLVGKYVNLTGELDGKIAVQGKVTEIVNCNGLLQLPNPGLLEIKSMNELINRIPPDMIAIKRDALKLAIDAFQTYPYDSGQLKVDYTTKGGQSTLLLQGPRGKRQFDVVLHPWALSDNTAPAK
jgi:hypothetical protein